MSEKEKNNANVDNIDAVASCAGESGLGNQTSGNHQATNRGTPLRTENHPHHPRTALSTFQSLKEKKIR